MPDHGGDDIMKKLDPRRIHDIRKYRTKRSIKEGSVKCYVHISNPAKVQSRGGPPAIPTRPTSCSPKKRGLQQIRNSRRLGRK